MIIPQAGMKLHVISWGKYDSPHQSLRFTYITLVLSYFTNFRIAFW